MADKLLPCPFCGTTEGLYPSHRWPGSGEPFAIDCIGCGMDFTPREGMDVIAAWNRRDPDVAKDAEIAALQLRLTAVEHSVRVGSDVDHERDFLAMEARRYASHYPEASDGRNTFVMFAEMVEARSALNQGASDA